MTDKFQEAIAEDTSMVVSRLVDMGDGTHAERIEAHPPKKLITDDDGEYGRLRVDVGQTGFFAGREFRAFHEYSIPSGQSIAIRAVSLVDIYLMQFSIDNWAGDTRLELITGGTVTTPFSVNVPVIRTNQTTGPDYSYTTQVDMDNGGVVTGGTLLDVLQANSGNKSAAVGSGSDDPIGMPPGTYYMRIMAIGNGTSTGVFKARWEERP